MAMETQHVFDVPSIPRDLALDPARHDVIPSGFQLLDKSEPIQNQVQIRLLAPTVPITYPESAYQWLTEVLDGLIDFGQRHGHYGIIKLTEDEYQWLDDVLEELIYSVGENQSHPLAPLMEFIIRLIANYMVTSEYLLRNDFKSSTILHSKIGQTKLLLMSSKLLLTRF